MADVNAIDAQQLNARLGEPNLLLLQITSADVFHQAHIPGAQLVTPQELVCGIPPATGRLPEQQLLQDLFQRLGYTKEANVVVYDDEGGGWAGRMGWTLDVIGHRQWDYLDGGLQTWVRENLPLAQGGEPPPPVNASLEITIDTTPIAEIADVLATIDDSEQLVWDVRSHEEYMGLRQASARLGHIPGAVNFDWLGLKDGQQRLDQQAHGALQELGLNDAKGIITHCQTHHRSGLSYMWGRLQGWNIRAYHGSWSEWGNREDTPIDNPSAG